MTQILTSNAEAHINQLLTQHKGVGLGDDHAENADKLWLAKKLPLLKADIVFLEQDAQQKVDGKTVEVQPIVDAFLKDPDNQKRRSQLRQYIQNYHHSDEGESYLALIDSAAECGKKVVFINTRGEIKERNDFMKQMVSEHTQNGESYIILAGKAHLGERGLGDPGGSVSKRLGIPALAFQGHFTPAINNPQIPLQPFCVFTPTGSSNYDGFINMFAYEPEKQIEGAKPVDTKAVESPPNNRSIEPKTMLQIRADQYDLLQGKISNLTEKMETMGNSEAVERLKNAAQRINTIKAKDPLVPRGNNR